MQITKETIWNQFKKYISIPEQESIKTDPKLKKKMQEITWKIIEAQKNDYALKTIQTKYYFMEMFKLFPESYNRHLHVRRFSNNATDTKKVN